MILTDEIGSFFFFLYLWIVIGNGIRFGEKYLYFSTVTAIFFFSLVIFFSPFWKEHIYLSFGLMFAILILPLFYFVLVSRLRKENEKLIKNLKETEFYALHDSLTLLPNRTFLIAELQKLIRNNKTFALFFIDLDNFKKVNDKFGHDFGDKILKEVGNRLKKFENKNIFIARLGGDEFALIIQKCQKKLLEKLSKDIINEIKKTYKLNHTIDFLSASIGIACHFNEEKITISEILKQADFAMYNAKNRKIEFAFFDEIKEKNAAI